MDYKPYSPEWHRKRYLKALDKYLDDYIENDIIMDDILSIICERQDRAHAEYHKLEDLELKLRTDLMLSTKYRLRLESICDASPTTNKFPLEDMIWAEKLAKSHTLARDWLNKARRQSNGIEEGSTDDFLNRMGLGDPDPSNHRTGFGSADEIVDWFQRDKPDDWRQRD